MTVKTINAIKSAEQKVYSRYGISGRQLADILTMYAEDINAAYNGQEAPEMYYGFLTVQCAMSRYCRWIGELNQAPKLAPTPEELNNTLPFIANPRIEYEEREDTGE